MIQVILFLYIICLHIALYFQHRRLNYFYLRQKSHENVTLSLAHIVQQLGQKVTDTSQVH